MYVDINLKKIIIVYRAYHFLCIMSAFYLIIQCNTVQVGSILVEPQPWKCYRNAVRRCRKMNLPLPLHYSDLLYKDPDSAVCACMARTKTLSDLNSGGIIGKNVTPSCIPPMSIESHVPTGTAIRGLQQVEDERVRGANLIEIAVGSTGCGLKSYSPLGTEVWGRSLLVFHSIAAPSGSGATDGSDNLSLSKAETLRILPLPQGLVPKIAEVTGLAKCKEKVMRDRQGHDAENERVMKRKVNKPAKATESV